MLQPIGNRKSARKPMTQGDAKSQPWAFSTTTRRRRLRRRASWAARVVGPTAWSDIGPRSLLATQRLLTLCDERGGFLRDLVQPRGNRHLVLEYLVVHDPGGWLQ